MRYVVISAVSFLIAGVGLLRAADDAKVEAARKDLKSMAGAWKVTSREVDGEKAAAEAFKGVAVKAAEDGTTTITRDGQVIRKVKWVNVDPTKKPKTMDVEIVEGDDKGQTLLGIYRMEDDLLTLCIANPGKERPTTFSAKAGSGCVLMSYTRTKGE
jgi:uncharacterized protein (TIGR03067 family)